jgi:sterol desaturase/sphingolipid hydroxylase (fatty acid hydroxylase superfamily)
MSKAIVQSFNNGTKSKNAGSKKLFDSPVLERLSRTHIAIPLSIFLLYSASILYWSVTHTALSVLSIIILFTLGGIAFTWVEYNVHRYIFHIPTPSILREKFQYTIHGVHHEFPKDKDRLAMPPLLSITVATLLLLLFRLIMGDFAFAFMPGFLSGYAGYLFVHYVVHVYAPPANGFKALWRNHAIHHYKNGAVVFGVSSPLWDYVYGTMPEKNVKRLRK